MTLNGAAPPRWHEAKPGGLIQRLAEPTLKITPPASRIKRAPCVIFLMPSSTNWIGRCGTRSSIAAALPQSPLVPLPSIAPGFQSATYRSGIGRARTTGGGHERCR